MKKILLLSIFMFFILALSAHTCDASQKKFASIIINFEKSDAGDTWNINNKIKDAIINNIVKKVKKETTAKDWILTNNIHKAAVLFDYTIYGIHKKRGNYRIFWNYKYKKLKNGKWVLFYNSNILNGGHTITAYLLKKHGIYYLFTSKKAKKIYNLSLKPLNIFAFNNNELHWNSPTVPYPARQCFDHLSAQSYRTARYWGIKAVNEYLNSFYAHLCLGEADYNLGLYNPAIYDFKTAIPLANDKNRLMLAYSWIGLTFYSVGNEKNAIMYDFKSLHLAKELNNTDIVSDDINNIAGIYLNEFQFNKALIYFKKSLALHRTKSKKASVLNNIGIVYFDMNNYKKAIEYQKKAFELDESSGNYYGTALDYLNLGGSYAMMKQYFLAKKYILTGISMEKKIGNKKWLGTGYRYLGRLYKNEGNNQKALFYYTKAYNLYKISGYSSGMQDALFIINKIKSENKK